jgi:hypothetical protein
MEPGESPARTSRSQFPLAFAAGACVVMLLGAGLVVTTRLLQRHGPTASGVKLPFGTAEQAYAAHIQFQDIHMARSSNLLNQQFTYIDGTVLNYGPRTVGALGVALEFHDPFGQLILRDTERLIEPVAKPLGPGQSRDFEVTLEYVPAEWNQQYPAIRVTGLILE